MGVGHWERLFFGSRDAPLRSSERGVHSTRGAFGKQPGISFLTVPNEETGLDRRSHRLCDGAEPHLVGTPAGGRLLYGVAAKPFPLGANARGDE